VKRSIFVSVVMFFVVAAVASAQPAAPIYVGIPTDRFNFVAAAQQQDQWCWAASVQMILNWYGIGVTQDMVVARTKHVLIDQAGSDFDISNALSGWAVTVNGQPVIIRSMAARGLPAPGVLLAELNQGHPILLTFATGMYSGHAVVITAASYYPTNYGPQIFSLVIRDPWPSPDHVATSGRVEIAGMALSNFATIVSSHWLVSVSR
jgi:hypothetical protein